MQSAHWLVEIHNSRKRGSYPFYFVGDKIFEEYGSGNWGTKGLEPFVLDDKVRRIIKVFGIFCCKKEINKIISVGLCTIFCKVRVHKENRKKQSLWKKRLKDLIFCILTWRLTILLSKVRGLGARCSLNKLTSSFSFIFFFSHSNNFF